MGFSDAKSEISTLRFHFIIVSKRSPFNFSYLLQSTEVSQNPKGPPFTILSLRYSADFGRSRLVFFLELFRIFSLSILYDSILTNSVLIFILQWSFLMISTLEKEKLNIIQFSSPQTLFSSKFSLSFTFFEKKSW